ncbi:hypothetical protein BU23DRAFT_567694 [Bimuria novae-zelandiae CBS 107.79]|uniref:Uncharacterized protein n=1 Tax=Bimuria novae-zelandiae CBS 107.79 TaxID=1447943 RepID=A0A6A5VBV5_9PLEO|nr:hypothetical protein BU23DRAFT_567694 [Bimuria novae-zelandiae CBS 107.79]
MDRLRAYEIIRAELDSSTSDIAVLQIVVKAVNNTASLDELIPTLLVFGAYPRVSIDSPPLPSTIRRAEAIQKAIKALRRAAVERALLVATQLTQPRKRGHSPGSKNKRTVQYLTRKEEDNYALVVKLRNNSVINTLGAPFKVLYF